jgi:hypothetical protein
LYPRGLFWQRLVDLSPLESASPAASRKVAALVLAAVAFAYLPAVPGEFLWDDHAAIVGNLDVHELARLPRALVSSFWSVGGTEVESRINLYYRPVVTLANALLWQAGGGLPWPFHLADVLLHLACVALFAGLLRRRLGPGSEVVAWAAAGLFALFPARAESVTWVSASTDLFAALFLLLGMKAFDELRGSRRLAATSAAFVLALFSKEVAVVAPALLLLDGVLLRRGELKARLATLLPVSAAIAFRAAILPTAPSLLAEGWADLLRIPSSLGLYLAKTVWPWSPSLLVAGRIRNENGHFDYEPWTVALGLAFGAALVAGAVVAWRKAGARTWTADLSWFALLLLPVLNLVPTSVTHLVAERNLYLAHLGLFALVARGAWAVPAGGRWALLPFAAAAAMAFSSVTVQHVMRLGSQEETWSYEEQRHPDDVTLLGFKSRIHRGLGRTREAAEYALRIYEAQRYPPERAATAATLLALAADLEAEKEELEALVCYVDRLRSRDPVGTFRILGKEVGLAASPELRARSAGLPEVRLARETASRKLARLAAAAERSP